MALDLLAKIERWKEAITLARDRKDKEMLRRLMEIAPSEFREEINSVFNQLGSAK